MDNESRSKFGELFSRRLFIKRSAGTILAFGLGAASVYGAVCVAPGQAVAHCTINSGQTCRGASLGTGMTCTVYVASSPAESSLCAQRRQPLAQEVMVYAVTSGVGETTIWEETNQGWAANGVCAF